MIPSHLQIRDVKLIHDVEGQSVAVEFGDGKVRTFTARELYEASGFMGQPPQENAKTAAQRRAEQILSARRGRR